MRSVYSARSAVTGSTDVARRTGNKHGDCCHTQHSDAATRERPHVECRDAVDPAFEVARDAGGYDAAGDNARRAKQQALPEYQARHFTTTGAEGHPHAELAGPLIHPPPDRRH